MTSRNSIVHEHAPEERSDDKNVTPMSQQPSVRSRCGRGMTRPSNYKARFEVQPDIEDVKFEGFELYRPKVQVDEKQVEEQLELIRQRHAQLKAPEPAREAKGRRRRDDRFHVVRRTAPKSRMAAARESSWSSAQARRSRSSTRRSLERKMNDKAFDAEAKFAENHPRPDFKGKTGVRSTRHDHGLEGKGPSHASDDEFAKDRRLVRRPSWSCAPISTRS